MCYNCVTFNLPRAKTCFIGCFKDEKSNYDLTYTGPGNLTYSCLMGADHLDTQVRKTSPGLHTVCIWGHFESCYKTLLFIRAIIVLGTTFRK